MLHIFKYLFFIFIIFVFTNAKSIESDWSMGIESQIRLISPTITNNNQKEIYLGLEYKLQKGWKTYWKSPGDGGFPQYIDWSNSTNINNLEIEWPTPEKFEILEMKSIGYSDHVIFPIKLYLKDETDLTVVNLDINYLVCKDICIPGNAILKINILPGKGNLTKHFFVLEKAISAIPQKNIKYSFIEDANVKTFSNDNFVSIEYYAKAKYFFSNPSVFLHTKYGLPVVDPVINLTANSKNLTAKFIFNKNLIEDQKFDAQIIISDNKDSYVFKETLNVKNKNIIKINKNIFIIFIALLGGFVLNAMPCVLPILSIKLLSILQHTESKSSIRKSFIITSLGIISSFILLALSFILLRNFGYSIGWGIQFQQPIFLMIIALIITMFSFNLFGFFEFTIPKFANKLSIPYLQDNNNFRDFFNGFFATLMATPCSAPFVGTALTYAFTKSSLSLFYIFLAMGIGMASPYIFLCIFPQMLKLLPKPGKWMIYLKYFLGSLLLGTTFWIFSILLNHFNFYFILVSLSLLLIVLIFKYFYVLKNIYILFVLFLFFSLPYFSFFDLNYTNTDSDWLDFNSINIDKLILEDNIVFVDVTADWCATCQFNKINVLNNSLVKEAFLEKNVVKIKADWTKPNKKIQDFLQNNNKFGIPFNIIYDKNNQDGIVFSELLSVNEVLTKLSNLKFQ